jgi:PIN domain nuclease of toxin-antitoxin system
LEGTIPEDLPKRVRDILATGKLKVSVASYWELALVRVAHVDQLDALPDLHRDPFDRMLIAQAMTEGFTLVSRDEMLARYGVPVVWQ